jgi:hypothetical protein
MKNYEELYYIVDELYDENTLYLTALEKSAQRRYSSIRLELGGEPLFFENAYREEDKSSNKIRPIKKSHMNMTNLLVNEALKNKLDVFAIQNFQFYPSIIIDDYDSYHEDFWIMNIFGSIDALDCDTSEIKRFKPDNDSNKVIRYSLNSELLDSIPEERRLIFRMPNTEHKTIFVHEKIVDIFKEEGVDNIKFHKLSEWYRGKQFQA